MITGYHLKFAPRCLKLFSLLLLVFFLVPLASAQDASEEDEQKKVVVNTTLNAELLDQNQYTRKADMVLQAVSKERIGTGALHIGVSVIGIADYQKSNTDDKFGYLMRHPTSNNQLGDHTSEAVIQSAQFMLAGAVTDWLSVYSELLYDPQQSFGAGTITSLGRNQVQLRRGFVVIGNTEKFPLYGAVGKMDVNFGYMGSVSPFTNSTMWHAFAGIGYGAMAGINLGGLNASFTAIQGGAQFRALHVPVKGTAVPSRLNNFSIDGNYTLSLGDVAVIQAGASFVKGTAYCQGFPVVHFMPCNEPNGAGAFYGTIYAGGLRIIGSYAITEDEWEGTHNPAPPLNQYEAHKVSSMVVGASYEVSNTGDRAVIVSGEFSNFIAGPSGAPWERQNQYVLGGAYKINNSSVLFVEIFRTEGYAPLNFISGGNQENPGTTHSDRDAESLGFVLGAKIIL